MYGVRLVWDTVAAAWDAPDAEHGRPYFQEAPDVRRIFAWRDDPDQPSERLTVRTQSSMSGR